MKIKVVETKLQKNLTKAIEDLEKNYVGKVGWFKNIKYNTKAAPQVAYIAAIHEYGYPGKNIPARPFMRPTIKKNRAEWAKLAANGTKAVLDGKTTIRYMLELIVMRAAAQVQETIDQIFSPKLKKATVKARLRRKSDKKTRGSIDKPLIDTGYLFDTCIGKVEKE